MTWILILITVTSSPGEPTAINIESGLIYKSKAECQRNLSLLVKDAPRESVWATCKLVAAARKKAEA